MIRIKPLAKAVAERHMPAVAVTDQANLFAMVKFYRAAMAEKRRICNSEQFGTQ